MMRMPNFAPITYTTWHKFPDSTKEEIWKTKFTFELFHSHENDESLNENTTQMVKSWIVSDMSTKWRQWKNFLKSKYFDEHKTVEEMVAKIDDPRVDKQQFLVIATYWLTEKAKEQSETNRTNRSKSDEPHCAGTRSFPTIIQTVTEESNGIPPSRAEMYIRTRTRKDGSVVNEKVASIVELMKKGLSESDSQDPKRCSWENDVYSQVKGPEKRGRIRCMGTISTSSSKSGPSCSQIIYHNEVQCLKAEVQGLKEALTTVISLFQKQFPNENVEVLNGVTRIVNGEVCDIMYI
ncbi:uncharacterized protein LOC120254624 [Dioscorea cayenensis subsp. rotundata]|uniref:Uncharacterized protein LOC120254624 n=1 Tax=Dioscorea cayennensis subsp. rotundata TaxID=55577 RepID=A0AB40AUV9_DIOCR|nr:uncharacterized protein LOC120254624 [Dioscorea cayenensis subsp. rotundata]